MINKMILNGTAYFGFGSREKLIEEINGRGYKKILLVSDEGLVKAGVTKMVSNILDKEKVDYVLFTGVEPNPSIENVEAGVKVAIDGEVDAIVAVGGGSVIDASKAIAIIIANPEFGDVRSLDGIAPTKNNCLPIIALPTTAGTAAEVTINYVISDNDNKKKMVCVDPGGIPVVSIIDTELMSKMPASLAAATGMDALTHAMEGYITKGSFLMSDMFHLNAMALIYKNLDAFVNNKDMAALEKVAYGEYIAGMGFSNSGLGIVHSLAHSLGSFAHIPHGEACAVMLPHVLKFNGKVAAEAYKDMGRSFGLDMNNLSDDEVIEKVVNAVKDLSIKVGIKQTLKELGVDKELIPEMAETALKDICTSGNPREVTLDDLVNLYLETYE
jgi:lactaldehyde reductase